MPIVGRKHVYVCLIIFAQFMCFFKNVSIDAALDLKHGRVTRGKNVSGYSVLFVKGERKG